MHGFGIVIAFLLAAGIDASAQEFTGSIYGRVVEDPGRVSGLVSREGAWTVTFADRRFAEAARATVLHGRPDLLKGLTPAEALDVVLPTCGLRHRSDGHRVVIARETRAGAIR